MQKLARALQQLDWHLFIHKVLRGSAGWGQQHIIVFLTIVYLWYIPQGWVQKGPTLVRFHVIKKKKMQNLQMFCQWCIQNLIIIFSLCGRQLGMVLRGGNDIKLRQPRSKKEKKVDDSKLRPWSELHEALLHLITKQLGAIDYIMFGCVSVGDC